MTILRDRRADLPERLGTIRAVAARTRTAQWLAFVALIVALVGAIGPAEHVRSTYSWPPPTLPAGNPSRAWYTPLLLVRRVPESLSARVPCRLPRPLRGATRPVTVLATARFPARAGALALTRSDDRLTIRVGERVLERVALDRATEGACEYSLRLGDGEWSVEGPDGLARGGTLDAMPVVSGVFSELDLRSGPGPSLEVTTAVHSARARPHQAVAWTIGALATVLALLLVSLERRPRAWSATRRAMRSVRAQLHPADAVVGVVLLAWLVLSPMFSDDGWVYGRERMYAVSGEFSAYFAVLGSTFAIDYWLEWLEHWLAEATSALVFLRLPALACLGATWVLCRRILGRVAPRDDAALWALASAFLVGALAWGMTLRPEPKVALLATGVLVCVSRFREAQTAAPLAVAGVLVPLAVTTHPEGVVALAPLLVSAGPLWHWARAQPAAASTIVSASLALASILLFLGSDLEHLRTEAQVTARLGTSGDTRLDELHRYTRLDEFLYGTPLRRASVALIALTLLAFALRAWRNRRLPWYPALSLVAALVLLVSAPSKWPWHFGALIGFVAVALAVETAALRERGSARARPEPYFVVGAASLAALWAWDVRARWGLVDLQTLDWRPAFESIVPLGVLAAAVPLVLLALLRGRAAAWVTPALAVPVVAFTVAVLVADSARSSWTLARQNVDTLAGRGGCGLAEELSPAPARRSLVLPELLPYFPCTELPLLRNGIVEAPDGLVVPNGFLPDGYAPTSPFGGIFDLYEIERVPVANAPPDVWVFRVDRRIPGALEAPAVER